MVNSETFVGDTLYFIKDNLIENVDDPLSPSTIVVTGDGAQGEESPNDIYTLTGTQGGKDYFTSTTISPIQYIYYAPGLDRFCISKSLGQEGGFGCYLQTAIPGGEWQDFVNEPFPGTGGRGGAWGTALVTAIVSGVVRSSNSKFIMTSYPQKETEYPLITLKVDNYDAQRAGMQDTTMDLSMNIEVRIWARDTSERDTLFQTVLLALKNIQFTSGGSTLSSLHNFKLNYATDVDTDDIKSKVIGVTYSFYNL